MSELSEHVKNKDRIPDLIHFIESHEAWDTKPKIPQKLEKAKKTVVNLIKKLNEQKYYSHYDVLFDKLYELNCIVNIFVAMKLPHVDGTFKELIDEIDKIKDDPKIWYLQYGEKVGKNSGKLAPAIPNTQNIFFNFGKLRNEFNTGTGPTSEYVKRFQILEKNEQHPEGDKFKLGEKYFRKLDKGFIELVPRKYILKNNGTSFFDDDQVQFYDMMKLKHKMSKIEEEEIMIYRRNPVESKDKKYDRVYQFRTKYEQNKNKTQPFMRTIIDMIKVTESNFVEIYNMFYNKTYINFGSRDFRNNLNKIQEDE